MPPAESRLAELHRLGQSPWFDYISRELVARGGLKKMVDRDGLGGVTSNPAIFEKAIGAGNGYDEQILELAREGLSAAEIFDRLAIDDVRAACDVLAPVYLGSGGEDGFVSIEVSPHLRLRHGGDHRRGAAPLRRRRPAQRDDQDPRHPRGRAGDPRVRCAGRPQHQHHAAVLDDPVRGRRRGLPRRARVPAAARPHDPRHLVGGQLLRLARRHARRQAAGREDRRPPPTWRSGGGSRRSRAAPRVANAKVVLRALSQLPQRPRLAAHRRLGRQGAAHPLGEHRHQEPRLPGHPVRGRAHRRAHGEHAARGHLEGVQGPRHAGAHRRPSPRRGAPRCCASSASSGIDMERVGAQLQTRGRRRCSSTPFDGAVAIVEQKRAQSARRRREADVDQWRCRPARRGRRASAWRRSTPSRLRPSASGRPTRRSGRPATRRTRRSSPTPSAGSASSRACATRSTGSPSSSDELRAEGYRSAVLLGMGGSSLAPEVMRDVLGTRDGLPRPARARLHRPGRRARRRGGRRPRDDAVHRRQQVRRHHGDGVLPRLLLRAPAGARRRARRPPLRGHHRRGHVAASRRRSTRASAPSSSTPATSAAGTRPSASSAWSRRRSWASTSSGCSTACAPWPSPAARTCRPARTRPAARRRAGRARAARPRQAHARLRRRRCAPLGAWVEQLVAESTGKEGRASCRSTSSRSARRRCTATTACSPPCGLAGRRGRRRSRGGWRRWPRPATPCSATSSTACTTSAASSCAGRSPSPPPATCSASTPSTSPTCRRARTSPRGCSPATSPSRRAAGGACRRATGAGSCSRWATTGCRRRSRAFLAQAAAGDYVALQAYVAPGEAVWEQLQAVRLQLRDGLRLATTLGYGPRYLHSTGQLHKGGPEQGFVPAAPGARPRRCRDPGPAVQLRRAQARAGARRPGGPAGARPPRAARVPRRRRRRPGVAAPRPS